MIRFLFLWLIPVLPAAAQLFTDRETYSCHAGLYSALPFWLQRNTGGILTGNGPLAAVRFAIHADYQTPTRTRSYLRRLFWDWGYGAEIALTGGSTIHAVVPEGYIKAKAGRIELSLGRRNEVIGLADSVMGTGPFAWSGNALPVPKIALHLPEWTPLAHGRLSVRAGIAHGWLDEPQAVVRHVRLHQKYLYGRWQGRRIEWLAGINHQVQWGGRVSAAWLREHPERAAFFQPDGTLPTDGAAWWSVWTGARVSGHHYNAYDAGERVGNHLGTIDIAAFLPETGLLFYRQQPYDMPSLLGLSNVADGLTGLRFTRREGILRLLVLEYLSTLNQGRGGRWTEDYFRHAQYLQGWTYHGQVIGTPFVSPERNRVAVIHTGWKAVWENETGLEGKLSYVASAGYASGLLRLTLPARLRLGGEWEGALAADTGPVFRWAVSIGWKKQWGLSEENVSDAVRYRRKYRR
ncbi:MAG: hypothetical protein J7576_09155 [Siphonobacter aquaeclarae]|nr:hypothetical protein [Siphonobacter aquaeclarae]